MTPNCVLYMDISYYNWNIFKLTNQTGIKSRSGESESNLYRFAAICISCCVAMGTNVWLFWMHQQLCFKIKEKMRPIIKLELTCTKLRNQLRASLNLVCCCVRGERMGFVISKHLKWAFPLTPSQHPYANRRFKINRLHQLHIPPVQLASNSILITSTTL